MQYSVPQFVDVEDKIIGPLTLKQFLVLLAGGLIGLFLWSLFKLSAAFFLLLLPTAAVFAGLAFGKFNGRPLMMSLAELLKYFFVPKYRLFHRQSGEGTMFVKTQEAVPTKVGTPSGDGEKASRLRRLAYLLDQKTAEEDRIIHSGGMDKQWVNKI